MKFTDFLGFKLFLIILSVMLITTLIYITAVTNLQSSQYLNAIISQAGQTSDIIKRSMHYSMLLNRREDIYHIIKTIGNEKGIESIRIYNKKGKITFSTYEKETGNKVDMTTEACYMCHKGSNRPIKTQKQELTRIFNSKKGYRILGIITPIYNEPSCSTAQCHAHTPKQTVLGVLDVMMPLDDFDKSLKNLKRIHYAGAIIMFLTISFFVGIFIWKMINIPVKKLTRGTQEIIKGNLNYKISVNRNDEIGILARFFNQMTDELKKAREELINWAHTLEQRVEKKARELQKAQENMIHMEKMASLGKLAATVAHEINNPLEGVLTYSKLIKKRIEQEKIQTPHTSEIINELTLIADETARCGNIVKNLLLFSRQKIGEFKIQDLRIIINRSIILIEHHLKINNIKLIKDIPNNPVNIWCDVQQLEQALLNIEINAIESMQGDGVLSIFLTVKPGQEIVLIEIKDTGIGIPPENLKHVFEPFFTTKEDINGTGLGLSVAYGIINNHGGSIDINSEINKGTNFQITLPLNFKKA